MAPISQSNMSVRDGGISGSEIAAVAEMSPFMTPYDLWLVKTKRIEQKETEAMRRGTHLAKGVVPWYEDENKGHKVTHWGDNEQTFVCKDYPICRATPDGLIYVDRDPVGVPDMVLEIKCPGHTTSHHWGPSGSQEIPEYYIPQVMWEMAAVGCKKAMVVALVFGQLRYYTIEFNEELFLSLKDVAESFYGKYIATDTEPSMDDSHLAREYFKKRFPEQCKPLKEVFGGEDYKWIAKFKEASAMVDTWERQKAIARNHLCALIGESEGVIGPWGRIMWKKIKDGVAIDWEKIARAAGATQSLIDKHTEVKQGARRFTPYLKDE